MKQSQCLSFKILASVYITSYPRGMAFLATQNHTQGLRQSLYFTKTSKNARRFCMKNTRETLDMSFSPPLTEQILRARARSKVIRYVFLLQEVDT